MRGKNALGYLGLDEINSEMTLEEVGWEDTDWFICFRNTVMNLRVP
jgi:hypothetical protein